MNPGMELRMRQHLAMTPQLQQALRLLQMSSLEFGEEVQQVLAANPFLEEDGPPLRKAAANDAAPPAGAARTADDHDEPADRDWHGADSSRPPSGTDDEDWTHRTEAPVGLHEALRRQLLMLPLSDRDRALTYLVIEELSDAGYFEGSLEDLAALVPPEYQVEPLEVLAALKLVQQLEPAGIGARSLQECLLLQLQDLPVATPGWPVAMTLLSHHFDLLARREFNRLQQLLGCDERTLHTARCLIRRLDPRPGRRLAPDDARYVVADILVARAQGQWRCSLNPAILPRLRINPGYADIAGQRGCSAVRQQLREAHGFLRQVDQRFATILRVASSIVRRQRAFFSHGEAAMKPLVLREVADELGLHESTVCRVTHGKYMATPRGLFEFRHFFSRQMAMNDGGACSPLAIRALLRELIAAEDPLQPLSDAALTRQLAGMGLCLARRTVTKYRTLLRLPSVELRRAGAGLRFALH